MATSFVTVDVFTDERFLGNQLAIVSIPQADFIPKSRKQQIAREFNFSETVFLHRWQDSSWGVNIFTPENEIAFAGHPVIGTGHYLFSLLRGLPPFDSKSDASEAVTNLTLHTSSGPVSLVYTPSTSLVHASIPHDVHLHTQVPTTWDHLLPTQPHLRPLVERVSTWPAFPTVSIVNGVTYVLCNLTSNEDIFSAVQAGPSPKVSLDEGWRSGLVGVMYYKVLESHEPDLIKLRVRMIAIGLEDPACGSGSSALCAYLALQQAAGRGGARLTFDLEEGTEIGRQSFIKVEVVLCDRGVEIKEIWLSGKAAFVTKGEFFGI